MRGVNEALRASVLAYKDDGVLPGLVTEPALPRNPLTKLRGWPDKQRSFRPQRSHFDHMDFRFSVPGVGLRWFSQFIQGRLESRRKLLGGSCTPVVQEIDRRLAARHVVVNGYNVQAVAPERLQNRRDLL
jgi:hypothetical protein